MKRQMFEELLRSVCEAGAILRGRTKPSHRIVVRSLGVRVIRKSVVSAYGHQLEVDGPAEEGHRGIKMD